MFYVTFQGKRKEKERFQTTTAAHILDLTTNRVQWQFK